MIFMFTFAVFVALLIGVTATIAGCVAAGPGFAMWAVAGVIAGGVASWMKIER